MKFIEVVFLFSVINTAWGISLANNGDNEGQQLANESSKNLYKTGVDLGIINPEKYSIETFAKDEQNVFKNLYKEYVSLYDDNLNYEDWLILNNFGLLPDTQESVLEWKSNLTRNNNKQNFLNTVKTGDILITRQGLTGFVGHAAIMTTDSWVVEMPGGKKWKLVSGIKSNNRRISKSAWYDIHQKGSTTVYRSPNNAVAKEAATWATRNYFNPSGGSTKTIHITYKITSKFSDISPSYCSKLVIQAYHNGTGNKTVIVTKKLRTPIAPLGIPKYFEAPYKLKNMGKF